MDIFANRIDFNLISLNLIMQKNYLLFNLLVLLFSMTFNGLVVQPSSAAVMANDYTPTVTEDEVSVFLETSCDNAKIWAWNDKVEKFTTAGWPGDAMTLMETKDGKNVFKWTYTGGTEIPTGVIFTHDGEQKLNGGDQEFVNHGYYVEGKYTKTIEGAAGKVMVFFDNSTANLKDVYCYIYNGTTAAQEWPGIKMSLDNETEYNGRKGYYTVEVPQAFLTGCFVINNGEAGSTLQGETVYVNGKVVTAIENTTITAVKKTTDDAWYSITGVRISKPAQPGLYIHNGKKVIIRK